MIKEIDKRINGPVKFLTAVIIVYIISFLFDKEYTKNAFSHFIDVLLNIAPIILVVFIFMFVMNYFIKPEAINKHLGKESGIKGWAYALISGMIIPAPPYVVFPLLGQFKKSGMKTSLIVAFLYNRNLQITFIPVMAYYFGIPFTIVISTYVFLFSIISGLVVEKIVG
jgi:uncharacterized membrane protein YraQ (UPF0718 family)